MRQGLEDGFGRNPVRGLTLESLDGLVRREQESAYDDGYRDAIRREQGEFQRGWDLALVTARDCLFRGSHAEMVQVIDGLAALDEMVSQVPRLQRDARLGIVSTVRELRGKLLGAVDALALTEMATDAEAGGVRV